MSNINYSDYFTLIENKFQEKNFSNSIDLCNKSAINNNKKYFAISMKNKDEKKFKPTCLIGNKEIDLKLKNDIFVDSNAFDDDIKSDKMYRIYEIYKTPDFDKKNCIKRRNLDNCLIKSQISFFNKDINDIEDKIIDINAQKEFIKRNVNESTYDNDYKIIRDEKRKLYETEKRNAELWSDFMKNTETKLNIRKKELNENYSFSNEIIGDDCIKEGKKNRKEVSLTNRQIIIQQQDEFNYKTDLIKKLNIFIVILILLFFITIIYYSDTLTKLKKNIESNLKNFSNDFLL
jgi:hypothetical protein